MEHFVGDQFVAYWGAPGQPRRWTAPLRAPNQAGLHDLSQNLDPVWLFGFGVAIHSERHYSATKISQRMDYEF
jgi:hypothetical protein